MEKISIEIIVDCSHNLMEGAFFPGEKVVGNIIFNFEKEVRARNLSANYVGVENTYVRRTETTGTGDNRQTRTVTYHNYHEYFQIVDIFMEPEPGEEFLILRGEYKFRFSL